MEIPNLTYALPTQLIVGSTPTPQPLPPPVAPSMMVPLPVTYQFQVMEYMDDAGNVVKVELQVQETCHDQYGSVKSSSGFKPVPRVQVPITP